MTKEEKKQRIQEITGLYPCPICHGTGSVSVGERKIAYGESAGRIEMDLDMCTSCGGKGTLEDLSFLDNKE
ncbi:MAG TPA: hypothetical protein ENN12_04840 [Epsilonproteobacteria bacterium]|nr:hypothetical protein [Campylobacterota bacterium]